MSIPESVHPIKGVPISPSLHDPPPPIDDLKLVEMLIELWSLMFLERMRKQNECGAVEVENAERN
jgi:hypothetical protein